MPNDPFRLPGSDLLRLPGMLLPGGRPPARDATVVKKPPQVGGGSAKRKPAEPAPSSDLEAMDMTTEAPPEEKPAEPEAKLSEACWVNPETKFHEESEVTVKLTPAPGKEHLTRVEAILYAIRAKGHELITKVEANADESGLAKFLMPIYKPDGHQGEPVEYILEFTHKLAKALKPHALLRKIQDQALKSADHTLVPGIGFARHSSFITPKAAAGLKALESKVKEWEKQYPKGKIVLFGHANPDEEYGKLLSERRAQSAYAFITNDAETWEKLYNKEKWGIITLQVLLKDMGHFHENPVNKHGPHTTAALKAFQKKSGLPETGQEDPTTRKALFAAYMKGKHDIKIDKSQFRTVAGNPWMGCSANNRVKDGDKPAPENRRVAFILINESKVFPVNFPCQDGAEAGCAGQCKKAGKRSAAGIKCAFYDELLRENKQAEEQEQDTPEAVDTHESYVTFSSSLESERQKVLSKKSIEIIGKAAEAAGLEKVTITSTIRPPHVQANTMYNNLSTGKRLSYAAPGQAVTDVYDKCHKEGLGKEKTIEKMVEKINALSKEGKRVSKHCVAPAEYARLNIVDIGIPSVNAKDFIIELSKDDCVERVFHDIKSISDNGKIARLAKEPCIHVEIKQ